MRLRVRSRSIRLRVNKQLTNRARNTKDTANTGLRMNAHVLTNEILLNIFVARQFTSYYDQGSANLRKLLIRSGSGIAI